MAPAEVFPFQPCLQLQSFPASAADFLCPSGDSDLFHDYLSPQCMFSLLRPILSSLVLICVTSYFSLISLISLSYKYPGDTHLSSTFSVFSIAEHSGKHNNI